jgi:peptide subunit release factor 1 (eRF1)
MLSETNLQELLEYQGEHPVLSVYLSTDPSEGSADAYRLRLRSMLKSVDMPDDTSSVENYFDREYDWSGRSVAVFSCAQDDFFRAYPLAVPVRRRLRTGDQPHVKPLVDLLDTYGGYGLVLVDKQRARFFCVHLGELIEEGEFSGESVRRTKQGGSSALTGRRGGVSSQTSYVDEVTERNMKDATDGAANFFTDNNVRRVLIGGSDDNVALFRSLLPKSWQSLVVGTFPISMNASKLEVLDRAMEIGEGAKLQQEEKLVKTVVTNTAKGQTGTLNLDDTFGAVHEGRVQTLVIRDGYRAPGYQCQGCEFVTAQSLTTCPFCGGSFEEIPDAVEMAVHNVMNNGGDVEFVRRDLEVDGFVDIGGLLRY